MPENQANTITQKASSVLITGGSGLIGKYLTATLLEEGYKVSHLSRSEKSAGSVRSFVWNPEKRIIDKRAIEGVDFLIHLAGENIGKKRWTLKQKESITKSRSDSARFLHEVIGENGLKLKAFISASATGIYGLETSEKIFIENDTPSADFLGIVCRLWEEAADLFNSSGIRTVKIRTAVVIEKNDSALSKLMEPSRFGFLVQTGNGRQYMPWIHIKDLCNIYLKAIKDTGMSGAYNAVAPQHVTHRDFMNILAKVTKLPLLPVPIPGIILRSVLGEMSDVILKGSRVSSDKLLNSGFIFLYPALKEALENAIG